MREHPGGFSIGVAAHPELHPRSTDRESDRRHLAAKLAEADFAITQFFFTVDHYLRMVDELADLGCDKPVMPGVMPIVNVGRPPPHGRHERQRHPRRAGGAAARRGRPGRGGPKIGVEVATELCAALLAEDVPGLHLYALNRCESVREITPTSAWAEPDDLWRFLRTIDRGTDDADLRFLSAE